MWIFPYAFQRTCNYEASWCLLSSKDSCCKFSFRKNDNENESSSSGRNNNNNKQTNKQTKTRSVVFITYTGPNHPTHFLKLSWGLHLAVENRIWKHSTQSSFLKCDSLPSLTANSLRLNILVGMRSAVSGEKHVVSLALRHTLIVCAPFSFSFDNAVSFKCFEHDCVIFESKVFFCKLALVGIIPNQILFSYSSDKDRRTDSRIRRKGLHRVFSSDPAVSSSIFVWAEREENLNFFLLVYCSQAMAQTFPRGFPDVLGFSLFILYFLHQRVDFPSLS